MWRKNPVTMVGTLDRCWLFTFQTPESEAIRLLPDPLRPVTRAGLAFWNIVVSHVRAMRPKGMPQWLGVSYWHVAYRLYASFVTPGGETMEGLWFARSECDSRLMALAGNLATDYRFHTARITVDQDDAAVGIEIGSSDARSSARICRAAEPALPPCSAFGSIEEAASFLKYKPFGLSVDKRGRVCVVRIVRDESSWRSRAAHVVWQHWPFIEGKNVRPEVCFEVAPIDYQWNRGVVYL